MTIETDFSGGEAALAGLFEASFGASEGAAQGVIVGGLVRDLLGSTPAADLRVFRVGAMDAPVAAVIFTRLVYPEDPHVAFLLSPMAVATGQQGQGIGQGLLSHALGALQAEGVDVVMTYGDPAFYGRAGFGSVVQAQAPWPLSMPHGWIGVALDEGPVPALRGPSVCVSALNRPDIW